ncbi:secretin N-terminal domain-containing protein [Glaciimonas sp. GG7]
MSNFKHRIVNSILMLACASIFAGCAVPRAVENTEKLSQQGQFVEAINVLTEAKKENPDDMRLDSALYKQVDKLVGRYYQEAEEALAAGDETKALERLKTVLEYDSGNMRGLQTIDQIDSRQHQRVLFDEARAMADDNPKEALHLIAKVLEERPSWTEAIKLRDTLMRRVAESKTLSPSLGASLQKPVSLTFRSHNLISIFDTISQLAGVNFIFDADVSKSATASISAQKTTAQDAINLLLATNKLRKKVLNHNTLLIYPANNVKDKEYRDMAVKTFFFSHANAKTVSSALKMTLKTRDIHIDERINAIVVRDSPETLELASRLVQALDRPEAEVTLDIQVLEVTSNDSLNLGVQYPGSIGVGINAGADKDPSKDTTANNIPFNLLSSLGKNNTFVNLGDQKGITLNMLQKASHMEVLANPKIRVKNGKKANIQIGQKIPIITNLMTDAGATSEKVEMLEVGLKFEILPTISLDGEISVDIDLTVASLGDSIKSPKNAIYYRINERKTKTTLTAKDNETQILAGLINREDRNSKNGLPGLSQMPLLDRLFGTGESSKGKSELVLVITPRIERKLELPGAHVTTFISGTESRVSGDSLVLRNTEGARLTSGGSDSPQFRNRASAPVIDSPMDELPELVAPVEQEVPAAVPPPISQKLLNGYQPDGMRSALALASTPKLAPKLARVVSSPKMAKAATKETTKVAVATQVVEKVQPQQPIQVAIVSPTLPSVKVKAAPKASDSELKTALFEAGSGVMRDLKSVLMMGMSGASALLSMGKPKATASTELKLKQAMHETRDQLARRTQLANCAQSALVANPGNDTPRRERA